ncbi:hypothetical protein NUW58_g10201 [Xylaria curta]|uniref:Uncharacterized protein n=1 Tax=Xylaria curta TaxID=42375 RepID=A0ACC1MPB0_9PEZI|nr:hypothetical protein NUW58_g10201 [Xylaria curta]
MDSPPSPWPPSASTTTSGPVINSPSNLSYSSGPSHTSTRSTSPDSASASVLSRHSSPLIDLSVAAVSIEHMPNTLLEQPADTNMDSNSFQSVDDRRNKPTSERVTGNQFPLLQQPQQYQQQQQQQQQQQALASPHLQIARSGLQVSSGHHRGVASANWRANSTEDAIVPQSRIMYSPFDGPATQHSQHPPTRSTPFSHPRMDQHHHLQHSAGVTSYLNIGPISDAQLDSTFAYCYDRGNGQYTRLIPADMLPPLQDIPALQKNSAGMVIVPQPRGLPSNGPSSNTEPVAMQSSPSTPTSSADTIQVSYMADHESHRSSRALVHSRFHVGLRIVFSPVHMPLASIRKEEELQTDPIEASRFLGPF